MDSMLAVQYPRLSSYAKNKTISVHGMMLEEDLSEVSMHMPSVGLKLIHITKCFGSLTAPPVSNSLHG